MKPENVNPKNFTVAEIVYDNNEFSIAFGKFQGGDNCLAMRWNGTNEDPGYPKTFGNPMWFIIHDDLKKVILKSIIGINSSKKDAVLKTLEAVI